MTVTNLLPAVVLAGPPNCGKSVLAYLLTQRLRELGASHYLLRAAPDGEGDWFITGNQSTTREIRSGHKGGYTKLFVVHMLAAINNRQLPLLVDIGGKPRGDQLDLLRACTHTIVLYRTELELEEWRERFQPMNLIPVAELKSDLLGEDRIDQIAPVMEAVIAGLDREKSLQHTGVVLDELVDRLKGIFAYTDEVLEQIHLSTAPLPVIREKDLAFRIGVPLKGVNPVWRPEDIAQIATWQPKGKGVAIYGRGPVWLAAALAVHAMPSRAVLFDVRYGWQSLPRVIVRQKPNLEIVPTSSGDYQLLKLKIIEGLLEPREMGLSKTEGRSGVILSGKLPRWAFCTLSRYFYRRRSWVAIFDPSLYKGIVVASEDPNYLIGATISVDPLSLHESI